MHVLSLVNYILSREKSERCWMESMRIVNSCQLGLACKPPCFSNSLYNNIFRLLFLYRLTLYKASTMWKNEHKIVYAILRAYLSLLVYNKKGTRIITPHREISRKNAQRDIKWERGKILSAFSNFFGWPRRHTSSTCCLVSYYKNII